jgi:hypothetical protein
VTLPSSASSKRDHRAPARADPSSLPAPESESACSECRSMRLASQQGRGGAPGRVARRGARENANCCKIAARLRTTATSARRIVPRRALQLDDVALGVTNVNRRPLALGAVSQRDVTRPEARAARYSRIASPSNGSTRKQRSSRSTTRVTMRSVSRTVTYRDHPALRGVRSLRPGRGLQAQGARSRRSA